MAKYAENNLLRGEAITHETTYHWMHFFTKEGLFTLFILPLIQQYTDEYVITNRRVIIKKGLIARYTLEMNLQNITVLPTNDRQLTFNAKQSINRKSRNLEEVKPGNEYTGIVNSFLTNNKAARVRIDKDIDGWLYEGSDCKLVSSPNEKDIRQVLEIGDILKVKVKNIIKKVQGKSSIILEAIERIITTSRPLPSV